MNNCRNCKFFVADNGNGRCHLHPPQLEVMLMEKMELDSVHAIRVKPNIQADYPIILLPDDPKSWCGDWKKL